MILLIVNSQCEQVQYLHACIIVKAKMLSFFADKPTRPVIMLPDKNIAFVGGTFTIKCVADGLPRPRYNITHNGTLVSDEAMYFKSTEWDDAGLYTCISINSLGTNSSSAVLIVEGSIQSLC